MPSGSAAKCRQSCSSSRCRLLSPLIPSGRATKLLQPSRSSSCNVTNALTPSGSCSRLRQPWRSIVYRCVSSLILSGKAIKLLLPLRSRTAKVLGTLGSCFAACHSKCSKLAAKEPRLAAFSFAVSRSSSLRHGKEGNFVPETSSAPANDKASRVSDPYTTIIYHGLECC